METIKVIKETYGIDSIKVRMARAEKGWTITKLSEASGIERHTISNIEKEKYRSIRFSTIEKIAKALGKTIEDFKK